jgi:hypothetical protein
MRAPYSAGAGVATLVLALAACKTTATVGYPAEYVSVHGPEKVTVTQPDKSTVDLYNPQIHGDTLVGFVGKSGQYMEIPLTSVQLMRAQEVSLGRTMLLAGALSIGAALLVSQTQGSAPYCANFAPGSANNGLPQPCGTTNGKPVSPTGS